MKIEPKNTATLGFEIWVRKPLRKGLASRSPPASIFRGSAAWRKIIQAI